MSTGKIQLQCLDSNLWENVSDTRTLQEVLESLLHDENQSMEISETRALKGAKSLNLASSSFLQVKGQLNKM